MLQIGRSGGPEAGFAIKSAVERNKNGWYLDEGGGLSPVAQRTSGVVQRKAGDGRSEDTHEQEVDRVAARVMRMSIRAIGAATSISERRQIPGIQRICTECEEELQSQPKEGEKEEELKHQSAQQKRWLQPVEIGTKGGRLIQRQEIEPSEGSEERHREEQAIEPGLFPSRGGANSLPRDVLSFMEPRFGYEFGDVRIHNDSEAAKSAKRIGAAAYTSGNDIYFGAGKYQPTTATGRELIAHELVHVIQQAKSRVSSGGWNQRDERQTHRDSHSVKRKPDNPCIRQVATSISSNDLSSVQLAPNVTAVAAPAELAAGRGRSVRARATAGRGITVAWSIQGAANGATITPAGRSATITAPAGSTGGPITIRAADAANPAVDFADAVLTLVEVQQPTFAFAPPMPAFAPANTMEASVCNNTATANAVVVAGGARPPPLWSIRGNRRGATIDPATGIINPSATQTGNITVRATDANLADAFAEQILTIRAHPTRITSTIVAGPLGPYGALFTHTFASSGGSLNNVDVGERVDCGNDPFNMCAGFLPIATGALSAAVNAAGRWSDQIVTPAGNPGIDVNRFLPSPPNPGLPQVWDTPQILYWRSEQCSAAPAVAPTAADHWVPFTNVAITAALVRRGGNFFFETRDNGVLATPRDPYAGPVLVAAPAAGSVCPAGVSISRVRLVPAVLAADGNAATTSAATATVRPAGTALQWSFPGLNFGAAFVNATPGAGNPAVVTTGNVAGTVTVRAADAANLGCFAEGRLRLQQVRIGPMRLNPPAIPAGAGNRSRATVSTSPGTRAVNWTIQGPNLGCVITANPDNSANIVRGAQRGRITVRATDQRDATRFNEASLVLS
jgi:hypothetical protein